MHLQVTPGYLDAMEATEAASKKARAKKSAWLRTPEGKAQAKAARDKARAAKPGIIQAEGLLAIKTRQHTRISREMQHALHLVNLEKIRVELHWQPMLNLAEAELTAAKAHLMVERLLHKMDIASRPAEGQKKSAQ